MLTDSRGWFTRRSCDPGWGPAAMGFGTATRVGGRTAQVMLYNNGLAGERLGILGWSYAWPSPISEPVPALTQGFSGQSQGSVSAIDPSADAPVGQIWQDTSGPGVPAFPRLLSFGPAGLAGFASPVLALYFRAPRVIVPPGWSFIIQSFQQNLTISSSFWWIVFDRKG